MSQGEVEASEPVSRLAFGVVAGFFALLHGWFFAQAVINLLNTPHAYASVQLTEHIPWLLLVLGVLIPPLLYAGRLPGFSCTRGIHPFI